MPMNVALQNFSSNPVIPKIGKKAIELAVNLAPNTVFPKGTILGNITGSANDVQTITIGGTPTGGTFPLSGVNPLNGVAFTISVPYNSSASALQTQLTASTAFGAGNVTCGGGALPGATITITGAGALANMPLALMTGSNTGLTGGTPTFAIAHTTIGRSAGTYAPYASGNSDGTQTPSAILKFDCATDANGNITMGPSAIGGPWGETYVSTPAYFAGYFNTADLVGLDTNAVASTSQFGKLIQGTVTAGIVDVY